MSSAAILTSPALLNPAATARRHRDLRTLLLAALGFSVLSIAGALASRGFLESDGGTHFIYARFAFSEPHFMTNVWGRPFCTALYALPAHFAGRLGVRVTSLVLALICGGCAYLIARGQGLRTPALAMIFTLGQPLVFLHSFSELTELPFAALTGLAFLAYQRRQFMAMAILAGLMPLARPEGFGFFLLAALALLVHRRAIWLPLLALPLGLWDYSGWVLNGRGGHWWMWIASNWAWSGQSAYQSGSIVHFMLLFPVIVGPLAMPATFIGIWRAAADPIEGSAHRLRCRWLIALLPVGVLAVHSLLYYFGKMASNGEARYLLVVAPLWGVLSASGWEWAFDRYGWQRPASWAALAVVAPGMANYFYRTLPIDLSPGWAQAQQMAEWYQSSPLSRLYPRVMVSHPGILYFLDRSPTDELRVTQWNRDAIDHPPPGTILIWDSENATANADRSRLIGLPEVHGSAWIEDPRAAAQSGVNTRAEPPGRGKPIVWHIFESPHTAEHTLTPWIVAGDGKTTWRQRPTGPIGATTPIALPSTQPSALRE
jgi:hypothetical protein